MMPPGAVPPGNYAPGTFPRHAIPPGAYPPGAVPPHMVPPGALPPGVRRPPEVDLINELEGMLAQKQYQPLLQRVNKRLAAAKNESMYDFDRAEMLLLRAEAYLQLRIAAQAIASFDEVKPVGGERQRAQAAATTLLIKRSSSLKYKPEWDGAGAAEIDILTDRDRALEALRRDELAVATTKVKAAKTPRTMAQVMQVAAMTDSLRALEIATSGKAPETAALLQDVREQARVLMDQSMVGMDAQIADINQRANVTTPTVDRNRMIYRVKQGLRPSFKKTLESIKQHCDDVRRAAEALSPEPVAKNGPFAETIARADSLYKSANDTLHADYATWIETGQRER